MIFLLLALTFHGRVPVSPLTPYNIKFVQRGFTERAAFEERIPALDEGLLYFSLGAQYKTRGVTQTE
jgi:hypothetical protein